MQYIYLDMESRILEFKSTLLYFNHLIKTCAAFANGVLLSANQVCYTFFANNNT